MEERSVSSWAQERVSSLAIFYYLLCVVKCSDKAEAKQCSTVRIEPAAVTTYINCLVSCEGDKLRLEVEGGISCW